MTKRLFFALPVLVCAVLSAGCSTEADAPRQDDEDGEVGVESDLMTSKLAKSYAGPHLSVSLDRTGGSLQFDCASGSFAAPLRLDAQGRFSVAGTFRKGFGAHRPGINPPDLHDVTYKGQVTGTTMAIRYTLNGSTETFKLTANAPGSLTRCL